MLYLFFFQRRDISNNELSEVPVGVFRTLRRLTVLHLSSNKLERLDEYLLRGLNQLEDVDLSRNELTELPPLLLDGITINQSTHGAGNLNFFFQFKK